MKGVIFKALTMIEAQAIRLSSAIDNLSEAA